MRTLNRVTYEGATRWLAEIGGQMSVGKAQAGGMGSIVVSVESASGQVVQRHAPFDDTLRGFERMVGFRGAFVRACEELKAALA